MMKRLYIIFIALMLLATPSIFAQSGLNINKIFDGRYRTSPNAVETLITGKKMHSFNLETYHSITIKNDPTAVDVIVPLIKKDGLDAIDKETVYREGQLYYGFYTLKPIKNRNRYLFYLNQNSDKIVIIYMEGKASTAEIKRMIKNN